MPTPSDSTDDLPLHLDSTAHSSCPPEAIDRPGEWRVQVLDRLELAASDAALGAASSRRSEQIHTEPDADEPMDGPAESTEVKATENTTMPDITELSLPLLAASPSCSNDEEKEVEHVQPSASTFSALELHYSSDYGIESPQRVCLNSGRWYRRTSLS